MTTNSLDSLKGKVFKFYSDPGHGWMAAKITDVFRLGIQHKISPYSYVRGLTVFLEEDCDASAFITKYKEVVGDLYYESKHTNERHWIRSCERWNIRQAEEVWKNSVYFVENSEIS